MWNGLFLPIWTCTRQSGRLPGGENVAVSSMSETWPFSKWSLPSSPWHGDHLEYLYEKKIIIIFRWRLLVVSILLNIKPPLNCISSFKNKEQQFSCINRGQLVNPTKLNVKGIITSFNLREFAGSMLDLHHWKCTVIERSVSVFFFHV